MMSNTLRQLELFSGPIAATVARRDDQKPLEFGEFHEANPHVYRELVKLARWYVARGRSRLSMKALFEILRLRFVPCQGGGQFNLNNNHTAEYARLVMEREADLANVFELRVRKKSAAK